MTAAAVLARARAAGLILTADVDRLRWRGPPPPADLLVLLRQHKAELLALLAANDAAPLLPPADAEQADAERQDRAAITANGPPFAVAPVDAETLTAWETELAALLARHPAHRIADPERASDYFAAEARRRLAGVKHDRHAAGLLMAFWRHARMTCCAATIPL